METARERREDVSQFLLTNRNSHVGFALVPKLVTCYDLERRNSRYFVLLSLSNVFAYRWKCRLIVSVTKM